MRVKKGVGITHTHFSLCTAFVGMSKKIFLRRFVLGLERFLLDHLRKLEGDINSHPALTAAQDISWISDMLGDITEIRERSGDLSFKREMFEGYTKRREMLIVEKNSNAEDLSDHERLLTECDEMLVQVRSGCLSASHWEVLYHFDFVSI